MAPVRWGIIGCGDVTEVKSGPAFQRVPGSELVAVMRRDGTLAQDYARRHGVPRWHDDADAILLADDIDAVYIATRPDSHAEYVERAAAAGKAVLVEKPMASSLAECRLMAAACASAGVPLWVAYYRRALTRFVLVKSLLEHRALGTIREVHLDRAQSVADGPWRRAGEEGGYFLGAACHGIDLLDFLFGPVDAVARGTRTARSYEAVMRFRSGVEATGRWRYDSDAEVDSLVIVGATSALRVPVMGDGALQLEDRSGSVRFPAPDPPHVHQPLVHAIVQELSGGAPAPTSAASALRTAEILAEIAG